MESAHSISASKTIMPGDSNDHSTTTELPDGSLDGGDETATDDTITDIRSDTIHIKRKYKTPRSHVSRPTKVRVPKKSKSLQCMMCGDLFDNRITLARHEMLHSRKKYGCSICSKKFRLRIQL